MVFYKSLLSVLLLWALTKQSEAKFRAIKIENIGANISATPEGLRLTWRNPNEDKAPHCYESFVRVKTTCATSWENATVHKFFYVLKTSRHKEYQFQIRMRYHMYCEPSRLNTWTSWTQTLSLGNANDTGSCMREEPPPQPITTLYIVILLPLLLCFLLLCSLTHERVRRYFLPIIPDPKHRLDGLFKMEMSQHCTDPEMECEIETVDIEIVNSERKDDGPMAEKLLEKDKETKGEAEQGKGGRESWARCSLTEADLQGYRTIPNIGEYIVYNGIHSE
ncbi:unnamed protein product [Lota lota]